MLIRLVAPFLLLALPALLSAQSLSIDQFVLIDADADDVIDDFDPLEDGDTLDLATLPSRNLNIRVDTDGPVESVRFGYDQDDNVQTENVAPWAFAGNNDDDYNSWTPTLGRHEIRATPYPEDGAGGEPGRTATIVIYVVDAPEPTGMAPIVDAGDDRILLLPKTAISLRGRAFDDGVIRDVIWTQLSGPSQASLDNANRPKLDLSELEEGTYRFELAAIDDESNRGSDTTTLHVMPLQPTGTLSGPNRVWQTLTLDLDGAVTDEVGIPDNPFLRYRLDVTFTHQNSGTSYRVPGYFAGDGQGNGRGGVWRTRFTPDEPGEWAYLVSYRTGENVSVSLDPEAGRPSGPDRLNGRFTVDGRDPEAPGFLSVGRLEYLDEGTPEERHYLKFRDGGYWLKGGADSPENILGYADFDNTRKVPGSKGVLHRFAPHEQDWRPGDPEWDDGKGHGIIGMLNYLASERVNSIYFLPMNVGGDGQDTHPFASTTIDLSGSESNDNLTYDVSKLDQWEIVFAHAQRLGIVLHFVLNEAEAPNKRELDNAELGVERKLFYREIVARFGHHNGLQWNMSEEYDLGLDLGTDRVKEFAGYLRAVDPYDHPTTVHQARNPDNSWVDFLGDRRFDLTSFQYAGSIAGRGSEIEEWRERSRGAGRPIPIHMDELRSTEADGSNADAQRKEILWPTYMSGGGGIEWYVASGDQGLEDMRGLEAIWQQTWHARKFFEENLPYWRMSPQDDLLTGESDNRGQVFALADSIYALYWESAAQTGTLALPEGGYVMRWYNPRSGMWASDEELVISDGSFAISPPPSSAGQDWALLIVRRDISDVDYILPRPHRLDLGRR